MLTAPPLPWVTVDSWLCHESSYQAGLSIEFAPLTAHATGATQAFTGAPPVMFICRAQIIGINRLLAIGPLVEHQNRMLRLVHLPRADSDSLDAAAVAGTQGSASGADQSITWDQGIGMAPISSP